jgi:hypothetical protein
MTMPGVERLLHEFIAEDRAGGIADPLTYLERVSGADRAELEALIDGYLARAGRRPFDPDAFEESPARAIAEDVGRALGGVSGRWPVVLPRLRHRARLRRTDVVRLLAAELDAEAHAEKIARYYHEMEQGTLPAGGVSDRVLEALGRVMNVTAGHLRAAGQSVGGAAPGPGGSIAFARVGAPDPDYAAPVARPDPVEPPDAIDALFTGTS